MEKVLFENLLKNELNQKDKIILALNENSPKYLFVKALELRNGVRAIVFVKKFVERLLNFDKIANVSIENALQ